MNAIIENIIKDIAEHHNELLGCFKQVEIPNKTTLLEEGTISTHIFFVKKGALRAWTNNNGEDVTVQFFFEEQMVSAFMGKEPSQYSIESIEPSSVVSISLADFDKIVRVMPLLKDLMIETMLQRLKYYSDLFISRIKLSPEERYIEIQKNNPQLLQRVPQHYIATYLGITSVSLSRIRNRLLKG